MESLSPEDWWAHLRNNARNIEAIDETDNCIGEEPAWLDKDRFYRARKVVNKFAIGIGYSSFVGQLLILLLPDVLEPLLATGKSKDIPSLYRRFMSTAISISSWYEEDIFDPSTKAFRTIRHARRMHRRVRGIMNQLGPPGVDGESVTWLNQWDMALSQFSFIGLAMIYPKRTGLIAATVEDLELINYYWRVLGYLLGIEDEFNACRFDKYEDIVRVNQLILEHEYKDSFRKVPCPKGVEVCQAICIALHYFQPHISMNCLAHWWKSEFEFGVYQLQQLTLHDRVCYIWTYVQFYYLLRFDIMIKMLNTIEAKLYAHRLKNKESIYEMLKLKYKNNNQLTYLSDRSDYHIKNEKSDPEQSTKSESQQNFEKQPDYFSKFHLIIVLVGFAAFFGYLIGK